MAYRYVVFIMFLISSSHLSYILRGGSYPIPHLPPHYGADVTDDNIESISPMTPSSTLRLLIISSCVNATQNAGFYSMYVLAITVSVGNLE